MAISCSSIRLHGCSYLSSDHCLRIGFRSYSSRNVVWDGDVLRKNYNFATSLRVGTVGRGGYSWGKKRVNFCIRSELQPPVGLELESSDVAVDASQQVGDVIRKKDIKVTGSNDHLDFDNGNGGTGHFSDGGDPPSGGGGGGGDDGGNGDNAENHGEEDEFGPILKFEDVIRETKARGANLPADMLEAAKDVGIREVILSRYLDLQASAGLMGFAMRSCSLFRNLMLADPSFLFKVGTEIVIDSCCATFAEVQKRGKDFWAEFELYAADLLVGIVVNVALVSMLAPYARIGRSSATGGFFGKIAHAYGALPSSVFEAERPGCKFSVRQRLETYFYKGGLYCLVGFTCGLIGQGIANLIMTAKRTVKRSEEDIPVPPLMKSAALWGFFLAVSSNTRYQMINGLERLVEASPVAKRVPSVAMGFTVGIRFANNIYGGMQFVDLARLWGVQ